MSGHTPLSEAPMSFYYTCKINSSGFLTRSKACIVSLQDLYASVRLISCRVHLPQLYEVGSQIAESSVSRLKPENAHASTSAPSTSPPFFPSHMSLCSTI